MKKFAISLVLMVVAAFASTLGHNFLYEWDDQWVVINEYTNKGIEMRNLWNVFTAFYHGQYAPLNELNYILIHAIFGYSPMAFHAASVLWHTANTMLLFLFLHRLLLAQEATGEQRQQAGILPDTRTLHIMKV